MDRLKRTSDIIKEYYKFKKTKDAAAFVKQVCLYYDGIKEQELSDSDLSFLLFLANEAGIPQYYDILQEKYSKQEISDENINMLTLSALFHDASLIQGDNKLHRYQKSVLDSFSMQMRNRFVLTAPTSFGKTFIVYEIIRKMRYKNILLVFPAISLLSENYAKIRQLWIFQGYKIHSLSEEEYDPNENNVFIFTPERYLSFMDRGASLKFDFAFIDEVYKIDNTFIIDQETTGENERDTAYRLALEFICRSATDMLLAGPYMSLPELGISSKISFINFANDNGFSFLNFNDMEIVDKTYQNIKGKQNYTIADQDIPIGSIKKTSKIANILKSISTPKENTIIYCGSRSATERYTRALLLDTDLISDFQAKCVADTSEIFNIFIAHLEMVFGDDWIVTKALKARIGIHHGLIPKYIQKEIIQLFNHGNLICLFSTTTITEGVNTTAKNIIITSNKKGIKPLKQFDAKNIAGRAGRFGQHFLGRVIDLDCDFEAIATGTQEDIQHTNYDVDLPKTDVDYQITDEQYLSEVDKIDKMMLQDQINKSGIPHDVFDSFKVIGPRDKLLLYVEIMKLNSEQIDTIKKVPVDIIRYNSPRLYWAGFQLIINTIYPVIKEEKLKELIEIKTGTKQIYSLITVFLNSYLEGGFMSMVQYNTQRRNPPLSKDDAVRKVADCVYNIFKYHLVKYLGLFDILFKYRLSILEGKDMEEISGLGLLLHKLEYNALSVDARRLSDFGVPFKLVSYYDDESIFKTKRFDKYEEYIDERIQSLIDDE